MTSDHEASVLGKRIRNDNKTNGELLATSVTTDGDLEDDDDDIGPMPPMPGSSEIGARKKRKGI
jgi:hypothetical protein